MVVGALGSIHTFDTIHRLRWEPVEYKSMFENFSFSRRCSLLAQPEPLSELVPIPIPVFRPAVPIEDHEPAQVEVAILQELVEIKREVRALRAQSAMQNASAVPQDRASAMLGCKRSHVFKLLAQGRLERAPKVGRSVMITVASIEALLAEGVSRKSNTRSRCNQVRAYGAEQRLEPSSTKVLTRERKKNTGSKVQDPGGSIRQIRL